MNKNRLIKRISIFALVAALVINSNLPVFAEAEGEVVPVITQENESAISDAEGSDSEESETEVTIDDLKDKEIEIESHDTEDGEIDNQEESAGSDEDGSTEDNIDAGDGNTEDIIVAGELNSPEDGIGSEEPVNTENDTDDTEDSPVLLRTAKAPIRALSAAGSSAQNPADDHKPVSIEISVSQGNLDGDGDSAVVTATIYDSNREIPLNISGNYYIYFYSTSSGSANKNLLRSENNVFTHNFNLNNGKTYNFRAELRDSDRELIASSSEIQISTVKLSLSKGDISTTASVDDGSTGVISVSGEVKELFYYRSGTSAKTSVTGNTISGLAPGEYYVYKPAYSDGNIYYIKSFAVKAVVAGGGVAPVIEYSVKTSGDSNVKYSKTEQYVKEGADATVYISPVDAKTHYIDESSIKVESDIEGGYEGFSFYQSTGELTITGIKGNIIVSASSKEKPVASSISVKSVSFNKDGIYSEETPSIQVTFEAELKDQFGNPVPKTSIYFKDDKAGVSYSQKRETDETGIATFKFSYSVNTETDDLTADYSPVFGINSSFDGITATTDVHLILQRKKDLVLYEDQLIGTKPGENNGKIINVPEGYELWTGEVHQGAIVTGTGKWIPAVNGEFTGLSAGQHIIRAGEKRGADNTFSFASDYAYFFIPRGLYDVKVDTAASENIRFIGNSTQSAEAGQTVYIYLEPDKGYEISEYSVDRPSYVGGITYDKENGYIVLKSVGGSVVLTVKAVKTEPEKQAGSAGINNTPSNEEKGTPVASTGIPDWIIPYTFSPIEYIPVLSMASGTAGTTEVYQEAGSFETSSLTEALTPAVKIGDTEVVQPVNDRLSQSVLGENRTVNLQNDTILSDEIKTPISTKTATEDEKPVKTDETEQIIDPEVPLNQSIPETVEADGISFIWIILLGVVVILVVVASYAVYTKTQGKKEGD